jgi:hypothetical protein
MTRQFRDTGIAGSTHEDDYSIGGHEIEANGTNGGKQQNRLLWIGLRNELADDDVSFNARDSPVDHIRVHTTNFEGLSNELVGSCR